MEEYEIVLVNGYVMGSTNRGRENVVKSKPMRGAAASRFTMKKASRCDALNRPVLSTAAVETVLKSTREAIMSHDSNKTVVVRR